MQMTRILQYEMFDKCVFLQSGRQYQLACEQSLIHTFIIMIHK